jgi:N-acetylmuramoyl-L-alanine amidase
MTLIGRLILSLLVVVHWNTRAATQLIASGSGPRDLVSLEGWARDNGLQSRWLNKTDLAIRGRNASLIFSADSSRFSFNSVYLWLGEATVASGGGLVIRRADLVHTVNPLLNPTPMKAGNRVRTIVLDAGHGGRDPGNRDRNNLEKTYTLLLAKELSAQLTAAGFKVFLTRTDDSTIERLEERMEFATRCKADLFISLHFNSAGRTTDDARGAEVFCLTPEGQASTNARGERGDSRGRIGNLNNSRNVLFAYHAQRTLLSNLGSEDRGVRRARFAVLVAATMPAILVEAAFMTHSTERNRIYDPRWRKRLAESLVQAVRNYRNAVER